MKTAELTIWRKTLSEAKATLKATGEINGEAAIAATVTDELEGIGEGSVQRTTINHWLSGKRLPNIAQFIALCKALKVSPSEALIGKPATVKPRMEVRQDGAPYLDPEAGELARFFDKLQRTETKTRRTAMAAAEAVIDSQESPSIARKSKQR